MASKGASALFLNLTRRTQRLSRPSTLSSHLFFFSRSSIPSSFRRAHSIPRPSAPTTLSTTTSSSTAKPPQDSSPLPAPYYELTFTCVPCGTRSGHKISKQGYHHGSVLITCPSCRNRHVISDHLKIFGDRKVTVEDLIRERGGRGFVKKGTLGEDGDVEFWEDGSTTSRDERRKMEDVREFAPAPPNAEEGVSAVPGSSFGKETTSG